MGGELPSSSTFEYVGVTSLRDIMADKWLLEVGEGGSDNNAISLDVLLVEPVLAGKLSFVIVSSRCTLLVFRMRGFKERE